MADSPKATNENGDVCTYVQRPTSTQSKDKDGYVKFQAELPSQSINNTNHNPVRTTEVDGYLQPVDAGIENHNSDKHKPSKQRGKNLWSRFVKGKRQENLEDIIAMDHRYTDMEFVRSSPVSV